eukprot:942077-Pleurochrysis_carterae.AAC.1
MSPQARRRACWRWPTSACGRRAHTGANTGTRSKIPRSAFPGAGGKRGLRGHGAAAARMGGGAARTRTTCSCGQAR